MDTDRLGLFRTHLLIKIFPEQHEDRFTFHSYHSQMDDVRSVRDASTQNSRIIRPVP
jgi:hypothetical protein